MLPQNPVFRGLLLIALMVVGALAVFFGAKYDNPYVFVPGIAAAVGSFVAFTSVSSPRR